MVLLSRADLIDGLQELIEELRAVGEPVGLKLVGGGALALRYFDRDTTRDVDAFHVRPGSDETVTAAAHRVARRKGWQDDWLNFDVTKTPAEPQWGKAIAWEKIFDGGDITIEVASAEALLVMKMQANRPGRDTDDIRQLLALCGVTSVIAADELYTAFYPGESLSARAWTMVEKILSAGPLEDPPPVEPFELS